MREKSLVKIAALFFSIIIVLIAAEIIMRFTWKMSGWVERPIYRKSANPFLRYELLPKANSGNVSVNSDGFRGREYSIPKPSDTLRIIILGDSEMLSVLLPQEDTLAAQLEELLNQKSLFRNYEVLNFGVEGYSTFQELEQLKVKGLKYDPDLIILSYCLNDPEPGEYYFRKTFLMRHSALVRYFTYRIKKGLIRRERKKLNIKTEADHLSNLHRPKYFIPVKEAILEIAEIAKEQGTKLVLVILPNSSFVVKDFKENYPHYDIHNLLKSIKSDNIIFIDLIEDFKRLGMTPQTVSINYKYNESHKNASALGVAASRIYDVLKLQELIPD